MNQVSFNTFIIYLLIFRLSIIASGITSIVLGYRLFCKGIWPEAGSGKETSLDANIGGHQFTLRNAAPGTFFALFGVIIISAMFVSGSPEMTFEMIDRQAAGKAVSKSGAGKTDSKSGDGKTKAPAKAAGVEHATTMRMRGDGDSLKAATDKGLKFEKSKQYNKAMDAYQGALNLMADPMNYLAWLRHSHGETGKALPLARMAAALAPDNANFLDTLAEILQKAGEYDEAVKVMETAAGLDPKYNEKLEKFRRADTPPE